MNTNTTHTPAPVACDGVTSACPKCGWHQPPQAETCAACGIVFAKFRARQQQPARPFGHSDTGAGLPGASMADSSRHIAPRPQAPRSVDIIQVTATSMMAALRSVPTLIVLWLLPHVGVVVVGIGGAVVVTMFAGLARSGAGLAGASLLGLVAGVVMLRLFAAAYSGGALVLDANRGEAEFHNPPGALECFGQGWVTSWRTMGILFVSYLAFMVPVGAAGTLLALEKTSAGIGLGLLLLPVGCWLFLRLSLAIPIMQLQGEGALAALAESHRLTRGHALHVFVVTMLVGMVILVPMAVGGIFSALIPVVGAVISFILNVLATSLVLSAQVGLFRSLED
jgi:hypothetical protein